MNRRDVLKSIAALPILGLGTRREGAHRSSALAGRVEKLRDSFLEGVLDDCEELVQEKPRSIVSFMQFYLAPLGGWRKHKGPAFFIEKSEEDSTEPSLLVERGGEVVFSVPLFVQRQTLKTLSTFFGDRFGVRAKPRSGSISFALKGIEPSKVGGLTHDLGQLWGFGESELGKRDCRRPAGVENLLDAGGDRVDIFFSFSNRAGPLAANLRHMHMYMHWVSRDGRYWITIDTTRQHSSHTNDYHNVLEAVSRASHRDVRDVNSTEIKDFLPQDKRYHYWWRIHGRYLLIDAGTDARGALDAFIRVRNAYFERVFSMSVR